MTTFATLTRFSPRTLEHVADRLEQGYLGPNFLHGRVARYAHQLEEEHGTDAVSILRSAAASAAATDAPTVEPSDVDLERMLAFAHELRRPDDGDDLADRVDPDLGQGMSPDRLEREADRLIASAAKAALLAAHYLELAEERS